MRLLFRDGDSLEGMLANNLMLVEPAGFSVVPPDPTFQNQRVFVPRRALESVQVLGVIGSPHGFVRQQKFPVFGAEVGGVWFNAVGGESLRLRVCVRVERTLFAASGPKAAAAEFP